MLVGVAVGLAILGFSVWRRPLRSFRWSLLDEIDLSAGLVAERVTLYYAGETISGGLEVRAEGHPPLESLKLITIRVWNGGFRAIEPSDFSKSLDLYVPLTNLIGVVSITPMRLDMKTPNYTTGFPIQIEPFRLRAGDGVEVRILTEKQGFVSIHDDFTSLEVKKEERTTGASSLGVTLGEWWRNNMNIRLARVLEPVLAALIVTVLVRACFGTE
jgi:hypothetical protein